MLEKDFFIWFNILYKNNINVAGVKMEEFENPILDEDDLRDSRKNKIIMLSIIILGTILIVKLKEWAMLIFFVTLPITFLSFFVALIVILVRFSDSIESLEQSELNKLKQSNPNINYEQTDMKVLNKKGLRKLKTLGVIFLAYIILCGITYITMILSGF